jgi:hypothetical protein
LYRLVLIWVDTPNLLEVDRVRLRLCISSQLVGVAVGAGGSDASDGKESQDASIRNEVVISPLVPALTVEA